MEKNASQEREFKEKTSQENLLDKADEREYNFNEEEGIEEEYLDAEVAGRDQILRNNEPKPVPLMRLPDDPILRRLYKLYVPSTPSTNRIGEKGRRIFAEIFQEDDDNDQPEENNEVEKEKPNEEEAEIDEELRKNKKKITSLKDLCVNLILAQYSGGNFDSRIQGDLRSLFGSKIDIHLPLEKVIDLDIESYWKRVYTATCRQKLLSSHNEIDGKVDWKTIAIQERFRKLIETAVVEEWQPDYATELVKIVAPYVQNLKILHLKPLKDYSLEKNPDLKEIRVYNYYPEECHHISLKFLGGLYNLVSLHIEFLPPELGSNYQDRYFHFSYLDMENLAGGLRNLKALRELKICRSRMDDQKLSILLDALTSLENLECIDFSYCQLTDDCAELLEELLHKRISLKSFELAGNKFTFLGMYRIMYGVQTFKGKMEYLGLSRNPINDEGVIAIGRALKHSDQVSHLNVDGVLVSEHGAMLLPDLLKSNSSLISLQMCAVHLGEEAGRRLVKNMSKNYSILELECRGCDLTELQLQQVKLILSRNNYVKKLALPNEIKEDLVNVEKANANIDKWLHREKNSILLESKKFVENEKKCKTQIEEIKDFLPNVPEIIPNEACIVKSTKDLLDGNYYDTIDDLEPVRDIRKKSDFDDWFDFAPINVTKAEILKQMGQSNDAKAAKKTSFISSKKRTRSSKFK